MKNAECACVGGCGVLWSILWLFLIYDTPGQHPRIAAQEREYIIKALQQQQTTLGDVS